MSEQSTEKIKKKRKKLSIEDALINQKKFFIDYSKEPKNQELVVKLLREVNKKSHGEEITFKDLVSYALNKISSKDLEKMKRLALGEMDKVGMLLEKYNQKHGTNISLGEFLVKQLKIS